MILDPITKYFAKKKNRIGGNSPSVVSGVEYGDTGTNITSGIIDEDFNAIWSGTENLTIIEEMRTIDAQVNATLLAIKLPILAANWFIGMPKDYKDDEKKEFIEYNLFGRIKFKTFLEEALGYLDFGFYYFEKILTIDKHGNIVWKSFAPRIPKRHYLWEMQSNHKLGITQLLENTTSEETQPEIPMEKLILFTYKREGDNYQGKSILRAAYRNWKLKGLHYKIQAIGNERFGAGTLMINGKGNIGGTEKDKYYEMAKNFNSNESSVIFNPDTTKAEIEILTQKGDAKANAIMDAINHHNKQISMNILAPFLNSGDDGVGSNAKSKSEIDFFQLSLQQIANYIAEKLTDEIKELIILNWGEQEKYPQLEVTEIAKVDINALATGLSSLTGRGLIIVDTKLRTYVREILNLPEEDEEEIEEQKRQKEEQEKQQLEALKKQPQGALIQKSVPTPLKKDQITPSNKKKLAEPKKKIKVSSREKIFVNNITSFEHFLEEKYSEYEEVIDNAEKNYTKGLLSIYNSVDTERKDGVLVISNSAKNSKLQTQAIQFINDLTKQLKNKFIDSPLERRLFDTTKTMALSTMVEDEKQFAAIRIDEGQFNSFVKGYISNMEGILFNDPRRIKEGVILNFGSNVSIELARKSAVQKFFNRNILKLSTVTHARGAYNAIQYDINIKRGFTMFKILTSKNKIKTLSPTGKTALLLFLIFTAAQLNKKINEETDGKNTSAINGLNIHHGSYLYFMAIASEYLEEEEELSREQRKELKKSF